MGVRPTAVLCLALVAWPLPAAAQGFLDEYTTGTEAAEEERWAEVERRMRRAIEARPEESRRLLRFLHFRPYVPHLYLGLALAEQERCEPALEALAESERQGVVPELEEEDRLLREARERCREHLAAEAEAEAEAERRREELAEALERARSLRTAIRALGPERQPGDGTRGADEAAPDARMRDLAAAWREGDPSLAERLEEVEADLERATAALGNRPGRPDVLDAIAELTRSVVTRLEEVRKEAEVRRESVRDRRDAARERVVGERRRARELLAAADALAEGVDVVARRHSALEELVERTAAAERGTEHTLDELAAVERSLERGIAALDAVAEPPPDLLLDAADTWLDGRPRDVLRLLAEPPEVRDDGRTEDGGRGPARGGEGEPETGEAPELGEGEGDGADEEEAPTRSPLAELDERARAHALLLRAAAAFDLFHAGGAQEAELLERARQDARECRRLAPDLVPVPRAFSPRFRRFFATVSPREAAEPDSGTEEPEASDAPAADQTAGDDS